MFGRGIGDAIQMPQTGNNNEPPKRVPATRVYSVPRRYDLATLLAVSLAYSLAFGAMRVCHFPATAFVTVASFVTCVGVAQAVLFKGKAPRGASVLAGMAFIPAYLAVVVAWEAGANVGPGVAEILPASLCLMIPGAMVGYAAGVAVGGIFLIAEYVRKLVRLIVGSER